MLQNYKQQITAKILILGESRVGKSSLLLRFTKNKFVETIGPTLGIDYQIKTMQCRSFTINMQLWDTAGQERFKSITESYYHGAHGIILVFDISDRRSFLKIRNWMENLREKTRRNADQALTVILVGRACFWLI